VRDKLAEICRKYGTDSQKIADAIIAALPGMVTTLDFQETNNCPPKYDTGMMRTGRYRIYYEDDCWKVIRGHALIIGREPTYLLAVGTAQADHAERITEVFGL